MIISTSIRVLILFSTDLTNMQMTSCRIYYNNSQQKGLIFLSRSIYTYTSQCTEFFFYLLLICYFQIHVGLRVFWGASWDDPHPKRIASFPPLQQTFATFFTRRSPQEQIWILIPLFG